MLPARLHKTAYQNVCKSGKRNRITLGDACTVSLTLTSRPRFRIFVAIRILVRLLLHTDCPRTRVLAKGRSAICFRRSGLFDRGAICFTRKDGTLISAATLVTGFLAAINPQILLTPSTAYTALQTVVPDSISRDAFLAAAAKKGQRISRSSTVFLTQMDKCSRQRIFAAYRFCENVGDSTLAGLCVAVDWHCLVWLGRYTCDRTGLERFYEGTLERSGDSLYKNFLQNFFKRGHLLVAAKDAREGDIVTTIEPEVQTRLQDDVAKVHKNTRAKNQAASL